jgi:fumarate hydratase class II
MQRSLMLVTALAPKIGYDNAAKVARPRGTTLKKYALRLFLVMAAEFDRLLQPDKMTHPGLTEGCEMTGKITVACYNYRS